MLAVARRRPRGLGSLGAFQIFTPGACGFTDLGVLKPECWALSLGPGIVGADTYQAAATVGREDVAYPTQPLPAAPGAVTDYGFPSTGAPSVEVAQAASDAAIAAAAAQTQAQNVDYFSQVAGGLDMLTPPSRSSVGTVAALIAAGLLVVLIAR